MHKQLDRVENNLTHVRKKIYKKPETFWTLKKWEHDRESLLLEVNDQNKVLNNVEPIVDRWRSEGVDDDEFQPTRAEIQLMEIKSLAESCVDRILARKESILARIGNALKGTVEIAVSLAASVILLTPLQKVIESSESSGGIFGWFKRALLPDRSSEL
ncbi:MAG: hypothetical protein ACFB03_05355 [Paracoccaceae bacterium]